jgi:transposase-like protein
VSTQRLSATERVRSEIDALFADPERELGGVLEEVARLSVRLVMQAALEAEVGDFLGRERYARSEAARAGRRNGYNPITVKTTAGAVTLQRPKLRGTLERFASRLLGAGVTRTNALESLVISGWVRGLSTRDIEAALRESLGDEATVSRSTVSRICESIKVEFDVWRHRDLSAVELDYLFVDGSHFRMHDGARSEPVLVAYGITSEGSPTFLHLDGVSAESTDACVAFLESMVARGLGSPVLVISDGAPGLCAALDQVFQHARRQRCLVHRARNVLARVSEVDREALRGEFWQVFDLPAEFEPGVAAVAEAERRAERFAATWCRAYPGAVECLLEGFELLIAHLHFPRAHWPRIRHTNLIERTFGESRRRVKVMGRLPGERTRPRCRRLARHHLYARRRAAAPDHPPRPGHQTTATGGGTRPRTPDRSGGLSPRVHHAQERRPLSLLHQIRDATDHALLDTCKIDVFREPLQLFGRNHGLTQVGFRMLELLNPQLE